MMSDQARHDANWKLNVFLKQKPCLNDIELSESNLAKLGQKGFTMLKPIIANINYSFFTLNSCFLL